jgi:CheY-like chemotaxis protein
MSDKILFVDDEPAILVGLQRVLRSEFDVTTAVGGAAGLLRIQHHGPFAVVVSDRRMPGMDGIEFLLKVKEAAPDTIRIMLTGQADLQTAIDAVNEDNIFRFLRKPCEKEKLVKSLNDGLAQYRLVCAEKELLEDTLRGSVHVLTEVLSLVNPAGFSRAARVRRYVEHVVRSLALRNPWKFEIAAMMSQLGCVILDPDIVEAVYSGQKLSPEDQEQYECHPQVAEELLKNIPRMESVAWMIAHQSKPLTAARSGSSREDADMRLGAQILRAALTYDVLLHVRHSRVEAATYLIRKGVDAKIVDALVELEPEIAGQGSRTINVADLTVGMILEQEIRTKTGLLVAARGQEVTPPLWLHLSNFAEQGAIGNTIEVSVRTANPKPN